MRDGFVNSRRPLLCLSRARQGGDQFRRLRVSVCGVICKTSIVVVRYSGSADITKLSGGMRSRRTMEKHLHVFLCLLTVFCIGCEAGEGGRHTKWASCVIDKNTGEPSQEIEGTVFFEAEDQKDDVTVWINILGFDTSDKEMVHGFHVHQNGAVGDKCKDAGGHFNPENVVHGGPRDKIRHVGDLGNIEEDSKGNVHAKIVDRVIKLDGPHNIIGKAIVVHATFDDLGKGGEVDSNTTGHAGARLGCCVIEAIAPPKYGPQEEGFADCKIEANTGQPSQPIEGVVTFRQPPGFAAIVTRVELSGFDTADDLDVHGFHVHTNGELTNKCLDAGGHFNPYNRLHGAPEDEERHVGDLGNVEEDENGKVFKEFTDHFIKLDGPAGIVGKSVVVHETFDDFNTGGFPDSNTTGHAGARLGCCTIKRPPPPEETWAKCTIDSSTGTDQPIEGTVMFHQPRGFKDTEISIDLMGFDTSDGLDIHGFHIHENGDLGNQCKDAGGHYNPSGMLHGGPDDVERHVGDLGNIEEDSEGKVSLKLKDRFIRLSGTESVIGRAVVVHATFDDFNRGGFPDSNTTGHAGARLGCCRIETYDPDPSGQDSLCYSSLAILLSAVVSWMGCL